MAEWQFWLPTMSQQSSRWPERFQEPMQFAPAKKKIGMDSIQAIDKNTALIGLA
ncbi:hypothetical protein [Synechococcus sp. WH 8020]|uniref:hypothetical protein n=1 Tax=Synechococcus sp. (strain WH8020) TaxID=32052 RepID=UPI000A6B3B6A|nr:hypothetical protein [Synechococcus sp. WH 8020]